MSTIYEFIEEERFQHNFENVEFEEGEFDRQLGAEGLHTVKGSVRWQPRRSLLPPDLFERYANDAFWRGNASGLRGRKLKILAP